MKRLLFAVLMLCLIPPGCGESASGEQESFESAEEARYARAGRPFAEAIVKQDYDRAYAMLSTHVKARLGRSEFGAMHQSARVEFFAPASSEPAQVVEMNPHILAGRADPEGDELDDQMARISYARYVGDVSDDVPTTVRRASLSAALYDRDPDDVDCRACYLTFLLVEEEGKLRVAHFFYRWHDTLD